jgi:hypothetical protein
MATREYTKNKLGMEDLVSTVTAVQLRNGVQVTLTGVRAEAIPFSDTKTVKEYILALEQRIVDLEAV